MLASTRGIVVTALVAVTTICFHVTGFTSQVFLGSRSRHTLVDVSKSLRQPAQQQPSKFPAKDWILKTSLKMEAVAENSTELLSSVSAFDGSTGKVGSPSSLSSSSSSSPSRKPPFLVTIEGDDQTYGKAITRTLGWVGAASVFGGALWATLGSEVGQEFFAGYLVEQSLSVDNLFVFLLLFEYFKVPLKFQDRVLNWGIYGAIIMRAVMISVGAAALAKFDEVLLVFASILLFSSFAFFFSDDKNEEDDVGENYIVKFSKSLINSTDKFDGDKFFTLMNGVRYATPMLICTIAVEISDVVFAVDSIPAVFGVTENPLIVFSSNMFAIMGLRSMYTLLSKAAADLKFLEPAVAIVLGFIGGKMVAEYFGCHIPTEVALLVVASLLGTGVGASILDRRREVADNTDGES